MVRKHRESTALLPRIATLFCIGICLASVGCYDSADITFTEPAAGSEGVSQDTNVQVGFSAMMDAETIQDPNTTAVTGSMGGEYTIAPGYNEETRTMTFNPEGPFMPGEVVTVIITDNVTQQGGIPFDDTAFTFTIAGAGPSDPVAPGEGEFAITSTTPEQNASAASPSPQVSVDFETDIFTSSTSGNVRMSGASSGARDVSLGFIGQNNTEGTADMLVVSLAEDDPFLPGEKVSVTFLDGIEGVAVEQPPVMPEGDPSEPGEGEGDPLENPPETPPAPTNSNSTLQPYVLNFEVANGVLSGGFDNPQSVNVSGADVSTIIDGFFADLLPNAGRELVVLDDGLGLVLLRKSGNLWMREALFAGFTGTPVAMVGTDWNGDGRQEVVVLTRSPNEVVFIKVQGGDFVFDPDQLVIGISESAPATDIAAADMTANGAIDFVVTTELETSVIEQTLPIVVPGFPELGVDGAMIPFLTNMGGGLGNALGDMNEDGTVDVLIARDNVATIHANTLVTYGRLVDLDAMAISDPRRIEIVDLEGDGDLDVAAPGGNGLLLYVNPGTVPASPWPATGLTVPAGFPDAFVVADLDGDTDRDLATYHATSGDFSVWFRNSPAPTDYTATELGSSVPDIQVPGFILGDVNEDGGLDLLLFGVSTGDALAVAATNGVTPTGGSNLSFSVPSVVMGDFSDGEFAVTVNVDLDQEAAVGFTVALQFEAAGLQLDRIELDPRLAGEDITLDPFFDQSEGVGIVEGVINGGTLGGIGGLVTFVFTLDTPQVGVFSYELRNDLSGPSGVQANSVTLESGARLFPDIVGESGLIEVESSLNPVTGLSCVVSGSSAVTLNWANGDSYTGVEVRRNGVLIVTLAGFATNFLHTNPGSGTLQYEVFGVSGMLRALPGVCEVDLVPGVILELCEREIANSSVVHVEWSAPLGVAYQNFTVLRDGNFVASGPGLFQYTDTNVDDNGHLYQIIGTQGGSDSLPTDCVISEVNGGGLVTEDPTNVVLAIQNFNDATVSWLNGENYTSIEVERFFGAVGVPDGTFTLPGSATFFSDPDLLPGEYSYAVTGFVNTLASNAVMTATSADALLPPPTTLVCEAVNGNDVDLTWVNGADFYTAVEILRDGSVVATVPGDVTSTTDVNVADGMYSYTVRGIRQGVPQPGMSPESDSCEVSLVNVLSVVDLATAVGVPEERIEIAGQILDPLSSYEFALEYDTATFSVERVGPGLTPRVEVPFGGAVVNVTEDSLTGTRSRLTVTVSNVAVPAGEDLLLASIVGSIPQSFPIVGEVPLDLVAGSFTYASDGSSFSPELESGTETVWGDAVQIDDQVVVAGQTELVVPVLGTYDEALGGYSIILNYDPTLITCVEVTIEGTISEDLNGIFIPAIDNPNGTALGVVIPIGGTIEPSVRATLVYFIFEVNPGVPADTMTDIVFGTQVLGSGEENETEFGSATGQSIEPLLLDGVVTFEPQPTPPVVTGISPDRGPLVGGGELDIFGQGFQGGDDLEVLFGSASATITDFSDTSISVDVPFIGATQDTTVNVTVSHSDGQDVLTAAYTYEALQVDLVDPDSGDIAGNEVVSIDGRGLTGDATVTFGSSDAEVTGVTSDGSQLFAETPPGVIGDVDVTVTLGDGQTVTLTNGYTYTSSLVPPEITGVDPAVGCPGITVQITGANFDAANLQIFFGATEITGFSVVNATTVNLTVPVGTGIVDVTVQNTVGSNTLPGGFEYQPLSFTSVTPDTISGCGGDITITGTGFESGITVSVGGQLAANVAVNGDCTIITASVPALADGSYAIDLQNPSGSTLSIPDALSVAGLTFIRGDADGDGTVNIVDVVFISNAINGNGPQPTNPDSADVNDDGIINIGDVVALSNFLNAGGAPPAEPYPNPGVDPTPDTLDCL